MKYIIPGIVLFCLVLNQGSAAKDNEANVCASTLQPNARLVFNAVAAKPQPSSTLREILSARVRELVFTDRLAMSAARPAAEAASECLRIARHCTADDC